MGAGRGNESGAFAEARQAHVPAPHRLTQIPGVDRYAALAEIAPGA
jgi:hypothetical protein